jgi:uncharacterized repeat protein (TIGR03803 family)
MSKLAGAATMCGVLLLAVMATAALSAQTLTTLHSFNGTDGSNPWAGLLLATNGNLYGTTSVGGANGDGTVFQITTSGALTTMHNFNHRSPIDGAQPYSWLVQGRDGKFYGTTNIGGSHNAGIVFRMTANGALRAIADFNYPVNGANPYAGLTVASNGAFYGTTTRGAGSAGDVYQVTPFGQLVPLYSFQYQSFAGLVQASNGNFYGTTYFGGSEGCGTIFDVTPTGIYTLLHNFGTGGDEGCSPWATLIQGSGGNFYGTTSAGGGHNGYNAGVVFKISQSGTYTMLHVFDKTDGADPLGALVEASDGNFYGTTAVGGAHNQGTIFKMTPSGTLTTLYSFCSQSGCSDGAQPYAGLIQASNGTFYGTTYAGGTGNHGTVFSLSVQ